MTKLSQNKAGSVLITSHRGVFSSYHCAENTTMHSECVVELHVTANSIKILRVSQQCFYRKFLSPAAIKCTQVFS